MFQRVLMVKKTDTNIEIDTLLEKFKDHKESVDCGQPDKKTTSHSKHHTHHYY